MNARAIGLRLEKPELASGTGRRLFNELRAHSRATEHYPGAFRGRRRIASSHYDVNLHQLFRLPQHPKNTTTIKRHARLGKAKLDCTASQRAGPFIRKHEF